MRFEIEKPTDLSYLEEFKSLLSNLVRVGSDRVPVKTLAKTVGRTESAIYRGSSPTEDGIYGSEWLIAHMNLKEDYNLVDYYCCKTGHLPAIPLPDFRKTIKDEQRMKIRFQKQLDQVGYDLEEFLLDRNPNTYKAFAKSSWNLIKDILAVRFYTERASANNEELF